MLEYNRDMNLNELEGEAWEKPEYSSHLVKTCHRLRNISISEYTDEDLRIMISQKIGLKFLVPVAIERLVDNPFCSGDYYGGDLLFNILKCPKEFWMEYPEFFSNLELILIGAENIHKSYINEVLPVWDELCLEMNPPVCTDIDNKYSIVNKFGLIFENSAWYSMKENSHKALIFKDSYFQKNDVIGLLFRINKLCFAKVKYFRQNIEKFESYKYHYKNGFIKTELWDSDFLKHKHSGYIIDYRFLQTITVYSDFVALCKELEGFES